MKPLLLALSMAVFGPFAGACGAPDDNQEDLTPYAGRFDLSETFFSNTGNLCPEPPTGVIENGVSIKVEKNEFEAKFDIRWGELVGGEIFEDGSFQATRSQQDSRIEFSGKYDDLDNFSAIIRDVTQDCTRTFDALGVRALP